MVARTYTYKSYHKTSSQVKRSACASFHLRIVKFFVTFSFKSLAYTILIILIFGKILLAKICFLKGREKESTRRVG